MTTYQILGHAIDVPLDVRDAVAGVATFEVDASAAAALVPDAFEVLEVAPGRAHVAIATVDYLDIDLGRYLEVGVTFFVRPAGGPGDGTGDGTYIWKLPVDSELSRAAGCDIWGFPKAVERIDRVVDGDGQRLTTRLAIDDQEVLALTVPCGGDEDLAEMELVTYTVLGGRPHAVPFTQAGTGVRLTAGGEGVELVLGDHPVAKELASLGLPAPAVMSMWMDHMVGTFGEPRPLPPPPEGQASD